MMTRLTRAQFTASRKRVVTRIFMLMTVWIAWILAWLVGFGLFINAHPRLSGGALIAGLMLLVVVSALLFVSGLLALYRAQGLVCPQCRKVLMGISTYQIVIATGSCGYCGGQVLEDA